MKETGYYWPFLLYLLIYTLTSVKHSPQANSQQIHLKAEETPQRGEQRDLQVID